MISKSLSTSEKYAALVSQAGDLAEFCHALYPLLVVHTDDFGRLQGDPFTVKSLCYPASKRTLDDFTSALQLLAAVELVVWYDNGGKRYLQIQQFEPHQLGLHRRTASIFPSPSGEPGRTQRKSTSVLDATEDEIEQWIAGLMERGRLVFSGLTIVTVERQVRRDNSYFDILATTIEGPLLLIEVKRQRVTDAAVAQVLKYQEILGGDVIPVVIGHGLAIGESMKNRRVLIGVYNDKKRISQVTSYLVKTRQITMSYLPTERKGIEEKRTEEKKEQEGAPTARLSGSNGVRSLPPPRRDAPGGRVGRAASAPVDDRLKKLTPREQALLRKHGLA